MNGCTCIDIDVNFLPSWAKLHELLQHLDCFSFLNYSIISGEVAYLQFVQVYTSTYHT